MYTRPPGNIYYVITSDGPAHLRVYVVGPHPILLHFLGCMTFFRIARDCLGTPREGLLDHAESLAVLIQNIVLSRAALYRIAEWAAPVSAQALGLGETQKKAINDDRIARCHQLEL